MSNGWFQSDGNWKDKLTSYNGQSIIYDTIGNPTDYRGMDMTWQGGRQLAAVIIRNNPNTPNTTLSFEYNEAGLRTEKIVSNGDNDENSQKYYWANGKLSAEICEGSYSLFFHYDANGDILGFSYKVGETTTEYYYVKNLQGDVLKVIDGNSNVVADYSYNAWGQILSSSGAMADINPIRYRGYYYDTDLALYYLQSRYYDPEVGRFINSDALLDSDSLLGFNLFSYCLNNPVNGMDLTGYDAVLLYDSDYIGHVGALIQDSDGNWWHFYWGTAKDYTRILCVFGIAVTPFTWCVKYEGDISLDQINADDTYKYDYEEMLYLTGDFSESVEVAKNPKGLYNLFINNCSQVTLTILSASNTDYRFILCASCSTMFPRVAFYEVKSFVRD